MENVFQGLPTSRMAESIGHNLWPSMAGQLDYGGDNQELYQNHSWPTRLKRVTHAPPVERNAHTKE
ncbi:hypothetical protein SBA4_6760004 [Candidatus Sulfopaludibacter sp. SbA4]|nr:hypothetical protein SBA4_6760004 [Candidatus Sulfopaludibacter sp. SbA4]